jgi:DNA modification methylase
VTELAGGAVRLLHGDCREVLASLPDCSVHSVVTDPPYELGFMGKAWDSSGVSYDVRLWRECLRVLKPGGYLLAFGGSRTYHRLACAVEDAGFEIRDQIMWVYGSGFPKSMDISKAIDKGAGAEREVIRQIKRTGKEAGKFGAFAGNNLETAPATDEAKQWSGWGTALKPAHEPIVMARKPLSGTVAQTVLEHGTGGINIDGCRIGTSVETWPATRSFAAGISSGYTDGLQKGATQQTGEAPAGRFPANFIHDGSDEVLAQFPDTKGGTAVRRNSGGNTFGGDNPKPPMDDIGYGDNGSASRFFYCAKSSKAERNAGLEDKNLHPTVKPIALMRYLVRLVTPPNGTVLDPFAGSGTTLVSAVHERMNAIGIEMTDDYLPIITGRVEHAHNNREPEPIPERTLFDND